MEKRNEQLKKTLLDIEKQHGKGSVMRLGDKPIGKIDAISSGSISLDLALGIGGYPRGRIIEIYGHESSGKTTIALHAIAEAQKLGGYVAFIFFTVCFIDIQKTIDENLWNITAIAVFIV